MKYLGQCEVCNVVILNYRSLGQHLRQNKDDDHVELKNAWHKWRSIYRATLRCLKCGSLWETTDKSSRERKRCQRCEELRLSVSKKKYESIKFDIAPDTRMMMANGSKAGWDGVVNRSITWERGDRMYNQIISFFDSGMKVADIVGNSGVQYKVCKQILVDHMGLDGYKNAAKSRLLESSRKNISVMHEHWNSMDPVEKAALWSKRYKGGSKIEKQLVHELESNGVKFLTNVWQSIPIDGLMAPRESDIKIDTGCGGKIIVLCDGEAFHGPKYAFGNPLARMDNDVSTARSYFSIGYSVVRYSETEIKSGIAWEHLRDVIKRVSSGSRCIRMWHPHIEEWA